MKHLDNSWHEMSQTQLYEDLSLLLKTFKKILSSSMNLITLLINQQYCANKIEQLKGIVLDSHELVGRYNYGIGEEFSHKNTFYRFICRIIEAISPYKNHQSSNQLHEFFHAYLLEIQNTIHHYKTIPNLGKHFKKVYAIVLKFSANCQIILKEGYTPLKRQIQTVIPNQKIQPKYKSKPENKVNFTQSETNFNKVLNSLNKNYASLNCLGLDFNFYKNCFFLARGQNEDLYNDYYERNMLICKEIAIYSRLFLEYIKRREKKKIFFRKNRFREDKKIKESSNQGEKTKASSTLKDEKNDDEESKELQILKNASTNFKDDDIISEEQKDQIESINMHFNQKESKESQSKNKRKTNYQLKQVYLTLKINQKNADKFNRSMYKNRQFLIKKNSIAQYMIVNNKSHVNEPVKNQNNNKLSNRNVGNDGSKLHEKDRQTNINFHINNQRNHEQLKDIDTEGWDKIMEETKKEIVSASKKKGFADKKQSTSLRIYQINTKLINKNKIIHNQIHTNHQNQTNPFINVHKYSQEINFYAPGQKIK